MFLSFELL